VPARILAPLPMSGTLSDSCEHAIVREQLQKSGVRLAHLLDAALGK
jgi:hypothetical protein